MQVTTRCDGVSSLLSNGLAGLLQMMDEAINHFFFVLIGITQWSTRTRNFMSLMRNISSGLRWGGDGVAGKWELAVTEVNSKLMALPICGGGDHRREGEITPRESAIRQLYFDKNVCNFTFDASKKLGNKMARMSNGLIVKYNFNFSIFQSNFYFGTSNIIQRGT